MKTRDINEILAMIESDKSKERSDYQRIMYVTYDPEKKYPYLLRTQKDFYSRYLTKEEAEAAKGEWAHKKIEDKKVNLVINKQLLKGILHHYNTPAQVDGIMAVIFDVAEGEISNGIRHRNEEMLCPGCDEYGVPWSEIEK